MKKFQKYVAIGSAVVAGPLLAATAVSVRHAIEAGANPTDDDFSLDSTFVNPSSGDCPGDICVDGYLPWTTCQQGDSWCFDTRFGPGGGGDGGGSDGGCSSMDPDHCDNPSGNGNGPPTDCDLGEIDDHHLAQGDPARVQPLLFRLSEQYRLAKERLGGLPADSKFIYPDGSSVTTVELYRLLSRTDFDMHQEPVSFDPRLPNTDGRYGGSLFHNGDPVIYTELSWMEQNFNSEDAAQTFIFHEISHQTAQGRADWDSYRDPNSPDGAAISDIELAAGEAFANALGWVMRAAMNGQPTTNPLGILASAPHYDPGSGSAGPTVAQVENTCAAP